jgi:hypothetical protein
LAYALTTALRSAGLDADQPQDSVSPSLSYYRRAYRKLRLVSWEIVRHPGASAKVARSIAGSGQSGRDLLHRTESLLVVRALLRRARRTPGIHVFDQGVIQELGSIAVGGDWHGCLEVSAPGPADLAADVLVRVVATVEVAQQRLSDRAGRQSRVELLPALAQERELLKQAAELAVIEQAWFDRFGRTRGSLRVEVDNDSPDIDRLIERLTTLVLAVGTNDD